MNKFERRNFVKLLGASSLIPFIPDINFSLEHKITSGKWTEISNSFACNKQRSGFIQLNSGSSGSMPDGVWESFQEYSNQLRTKHPYRVLASWGDKIKQSKQGLAEMLDCKVNGLTFMRNTTEALHTIMFGLHIKDKQKILAAKHDYPFALSGMEKMARFDSMNLQMLDLDLTSLTDDQIIDAYDKEIDDSISLVLVTGMTHREGRILPVKEITSIAHDRGALVLCDGAHCAAQFQHSITEWSVDFYATSLHKWLNAPLGTGLLYVRPDLIPEVDALHPLFNDDTQTITKYTGLGTRAFQNMPTVNTCIKTLDQLGMESKESRLKSLTDFWMDKMEAIPGVSFSIDRKRMKYCALGGFNIEGVKMGKLYSYLEDEKKILVKKTSINRKSYFRITPNLFTLENDLDEFCDAVADFSY